MALNYYQVAKKASSQIGRHPGLQYLQRTCLRAGRVLDVGCGEGTRLNTLLPSGKPGWGTDISPQAIDLAKSQYPGHRFSLAAARRLPFSNGSFDLVYSAFVLEHTSDPGIFLEEMLRVCRPQGIVVILAPNFGAPNRRSPNSVQRPLVKLLAGFVADFSPPGSPADWIGVIPKSTYQHIDDDTTVEPYLRSLRHFFVRRKLTILACSSLWVLEAPVLNLPQLLFCLLGRAGVYPFTYWGPQIFLAAKKTGT